MVLCYGAARDCRLCPCGVSLQQWQGSQPCESHVHLISIIGVRMASGDGGQPQTLEMAVPCEVQEANGALCLGLHCELITCPAVTMVAPCSFLQYQFTVSNAQSASLGYLRARQLQCPVQQASNILPPPPLGRLMKLLRLATGSALGSQKEEQVSWYVTGSTSCECYDVTCFFILRIHL